MLLRFRTVKPGKGGDDARWIENDLTPAIKKGAFRGFRYSRLAMGGNSKIWISASQYSNRAAMDDPNFFAHMSGDERGALSSPSNDMVVDSEVRILQYRADLSY